jgi:hypothetical protein
MGARAVERANAFMRSVHRLMRHAANVRVRGVENLDQPGGCVEESDAVESKRGAAMITLKGRGRIIPAWYEGPDGFEISHLLRRPAIRVTFGAPIETAPFASGGKEAAVRLTAAMDAAMRAARETPWPRPRE